MIGFLPDPGVGCFSVGCLGSKLQGVSVSSPITELQLQVYQPVLAFAWVLDLNSGPHTYVARFLASSHWLNFRLQMFGDQQVQYTYNKISSVVLMSTELRHRVPSGCCHWRQAVTPPLLSDVGHFYLYYFEAWSYVIFYYYLSLYLE